MRKESVTEIDEAKRHEVKVLFPAVKEKNDVSISDETTHIVDVTELTEHKGKVRMSSQEKAELLFKNGRKMYLRSIVLFIVFSVFGLMLFYRETDKTAAALNILKKYRGASGVSGALEVCFSEWLFAIVLFASGMTAFAPFVSICVRIYRFTRIGFYSGIFLNFCLTGGNPILRTASYLFLSSLEILLFIYYNVEVGKFSELASDSVNNAVKRDNFIPYLFNLLLYCAVTFAIVYLKILAF